MQKTDENSNKYDERQLFPSRHAHWIYCTLGRRTCIMLDLWESIDSSMLDGSIA